jgi:hypothetical protein
MDRRLSRRGIAVLALLFVVTTPLFADREPRIVIVSGDDRSVTWRELVPARVAADPDRGVYHRTGCPAIRPDMQWIAPAAATLRTLTAHGCPVPDTPEWATHTEKRHARDPHVISVLFLGNSLTYYNEIPGTTSAMAAREKRPLLVDAVTRSGVTLEQLWADTAALKRIWQDHWDYVVVQGGAGSAGPLFHADVYNRYLTRFADEIRKSGATPLFYQVWSLQTPAEHEAASLVAAKKNRMRVVPAGSAWHELIRNGRFKRLDRDLVHPDALGAYLVACSVYSTIYDKPAHGTPHDFRQLAVSHEVSDDALREQTIDAEDTRALQDAAWRAVQRMKAMP